MSLTIPLSVFLNKYPGDILTLRRVPGEPRWKSWTTVGGQCITNRYGGEMLRIEIPDIQNEEIT